MVLLPMLIAILSLVVLVQSWPQFLIDGDDLGDSVTLPVIPYAPVSAGSPPDQVAPSEAVSIPQSRRRNLPVVDNGNGILTLPVIHVKNKPGPVPRAVEFQLENRSDVAYYARHIGTPPQPVYAQLDTGSFELWVNPDCSSLSATSDKRFCQAIGSYDPDNSSTVEKTDVSKTLRYGIGRANITYVKDDISLSESTKIKGVQFGVATSSSDQFAGILGIGFGEGITTKYKNFIDELADQGITKTKAFSLALGSKYEQEGVVIFGGVDTAKFAGTLAPLPIVPAENSPDGVPRYWVEMESISLTPPSGNTKEWGNSSMPVFLDSGATLTLLPPTIVETIARDFGSTSTDVNGFHRVDCRLMEIDGTIDFKFNGVTVKVPYREVIREIRTDPPTCYMGIVPSKEFALLGDTFLRSAYVVFDLDSRIAYMAPYSNCGTKLATINNPADLENLSGECDSTREQSVTKTPSAMSTPVQSTISAISTPTAAAENAQASTIIDSVGSSTSSTGQGAQGGGIRASVSWLALAFCLGMGLSASL